jgi:hypothetical protein|tara:strand:+ start:677 stop:910 length:234 start_codon:yes stop_codon:yes gene_type:complete
MNMKCGEIWGITFLDHVEDGKKPITFEVFGRVVRVGKRSVTLASWDYAGGKGRDRDNMKTFCIVQSCIIGSQRLRVD